MVTEFANDPRVVTAVMNQGELEYVFQRYWRNVYMRGPLIHDPSGSIAGNAYAQPSTGLPVERAFIIGPDQTVVLPVFSYKPQLMIDTIYDVLATMPPVGDVNGDGKVTAQDLTLLLAAWLSKPGDPNWNPKADIDYDKIVGPQDLTLLLSNWGYGT